MSRRSQWALVGAVLFFATALRANEPVAAQRVLVLPLQDRAGDSAAAATVDSVLRQGFGERGVVVDASEARSAARRYRLRNPDIANPEVLRRLGREMGADWIVSATIHEALRGLVPRVTLSIRLLDAPTGELRWAGFEAASGLDRQSVLGLGIVWELEPLAESVVLRMLTDLPVTGAREPRPERKGVAAAAAGLGDVAIVPFAGLARAQPARTAEAVTEAARVAALSFGSRLVSVNVLSRALRSGPMTWGEIDVATRERVREMTGADTILTGVVEAYEEGSGVEPTPRVMVSMRLVDARTGRLLAARGMERGGRDRQRLFELGRVYSGGVLSKTVTEILLERILLQALERTSG